MSDEQKTYKTLRPFPHRGRVVATGGKVQLHPRQARYLLGTHLEDPDAPQKAPKADKPALAPAAKAESKPTTITKGDS